MLGAMGSEGRRKCLSRESTEELAEGLRDRKDKLFLERFVDRAKPGGAGVREDYRVRVWASEEAVYFVGRPGGAGMMNSGFEQDGPHR